MKLTIVALGLVALGATLPLRADEDPWEVRLRAVNIQTTNTSDAFGNYPKNELVVSNKTFPAVDVTYFFNPHLSAELNLTLPQQHNLTLYHSGAQLATFKEMPTTLTAQWHVLPGGPFDPYVGLGLNATRISNVNNSSASTMLALSSSSLGLAGQFGADFRFASNWRLNLDAQYVMMQSNVVVNGTKVTTLHLDPWLLGVGLGYRFGGHASAPSMAPAPAPEVAPEPPPVVVAPPPPAPVMVAPPRPPVVAPPPPPQPMPAPQAAPLPVKIILNNAKLHFLNGKNDLSPEGAQTVREVARQLKQSRETLTLKVTGYTSSSGKPAVNKALSKRRADAVAKLLVAEGLPAKNVLTVGAGAARPIGDNKTPEGQALNRRVEIEIVTDDKIEWKTPAAKPAMPRKFVKPAK